MDSTATRVTLPNGRPLHAFTPPQGGADRAVVLLHERYGLVQHTLDLGERFASEGFIAFVPDLFEGLVDNYDAIRAGDARGPMFDAEIVKTVEQCLTQLESDHGIAPASVAVMGVCQSGRHPICVAHANPAIGAAVLFYGGAQKKDWNVDEEKPIALETMLSSIEVPLFATFAEGDHVLSVDDVLRFRGVLENARRSYHIRIQADAPHGFMDSTKPGRYRPEATEQSWSAMRAFLDATLGKERRSDRVEWVFTSDIATDYDYASNVRME